MLLPRSLPGHISPQILPPAGSWLRWRAPILKSSPPRSIPTGQISPTTVKIDLRKSGALSTATVMAALKRPEPVLRAVGLVVVSVAQRSFTEASLRPSAWAPLAPSTLKQRKAQGRGSSPLLKTGLLSRSPRIGSVSSTVEVVSDRPYAAYHQLGTKKAPARPFFPFTKSGKPTAKVQALIRVAAVRALNL